VPRYITPPPSAPTTTTTTMRPYKPVKCLTYTKLSYSPAHPHHNLTVSRAHFFYWLRSKIGVTYFFEFFRWYFNWSRAHFCIFRVGNAHQACLLTRSVCVNNINDWNSRFIIIENVGDVRTSFRSTGQIIWRAKGNEQYIIHFIFCRKFFNVITLTLFHFI